MLHIDKLYTIRTKPYQWGLFWWGPQCRWIAQTLPPSLALFILCHQWVSLQFIWPAFFFSPSVTVTTLNCFSQIYPLSFPPLPDLSFFILPFSLCGQGQAQWRKKLLSTRANICAVLNWANMDKANTISFSVPGCLPCCLFIRSLSVLLLQSSPLGNQCTHCAHVVFKQITGWGTNLIILSWSLYISVSSSLGTPVQSYPTDLPHVTGFANFHITETLSTNVSIIPAIMFRLD